MSFVSIPSKAPSNILILLSVNFSTAFSEYFSGCVSESWIIFRLIPYTGDFGPIKILAFLALVIPVYKSCK